MANFGLMIDEFILAGILVSVLILDFAGCRREIIGRFCTGSVFALLVFVCLNRQEGSLLNGAFVYDGISWYSKITILAGTVLTGLLSIRTLGIREKYSGAYYALLLASVLGMMVLVSSKELITLYVALETATLSLYGLAAIRKEDDFSLEAGIKYLILGALSSGILLYGLSVIYLLTGTTRLETILAMDPSLLFSPLFITGMVLTLLGAGFKLSMVPLHVWTPDVYQGAPTPITAFISVSSKAAGFILVLRLFPYTLAAFGAFWVPLLAVLAFLTMTLGNLMAIPQKNLKRLLAYSSISQAGYILVGFVGDPVSGMGSVLFYLLVYTFTNIAAFAVVLGFAHATGSEDLEDYSGLAQRDPLLALTFLLALLSLAGIPPMAGFAGKFYLFYAAMKNGYLWLVIAGALNSTVSLYYYLLILKRMYIFDPKKDYPKLALPFSLRAALLISIAAILLLGVFPGPVMDLATSAAKGIFQIP